MDLKSKKVLVTGGAGFLGPHLMRGLLKHGVAEKNIFAPTFAELDLRKREDCKKAAAGADMVIHAAAVTGNVELHRSRPAEIFYDNLMMGVELMEAARGEGVEKFVTIGSATEYPDDARLPFREGDLWGGPLEPLHAPYTIAKKMLLVQAQAYRKQYGFNAVHLLLTNMYGPGEHEEGGPIPALICHMGEAKKNNLPEVVVWGTGRATRDFIYVEDAAEGIVRALLDYNKEEPVNLGSGFEISIKELAELIKKLVGYKGALKFDSSKPDGQPRRVLDTGRAEREFGFKATVGFEDGLKKTIAYHGYGS